MFIQKSYVEKLLICHLCNKRYCDEMEPLILPCGQTVCSKCVTTIEFDEQTFKCISCQNDHLNPNDYNFTVNKMAKMLSSIEAKNNLKEDDFNEKIEIERKKFKEQCKELKHQAKQSANKRAQEINNNLKECLDRIDDYEREYDRMNSTEIRGKPSKNQFNFSFELETRLESSKLENNRIKFEMNDNQLESDILGCLIRKHKNVPYSAIISCTDDFAIKTFSLESGKQLRTYRGHSKKVNCIRVVLKSNTNINGNPESKYIASGSDDKTIKIWDINSKVCVTTLEGHSAAVKCLEVLSENIFASGSADHMIKLWNLRYEKCIMTLEGHSDWVNYIVKLSDELIVSCSDDKLIKVWRSYTGECLCTLKGHNDNVNCIEKVSDDKIISCSSDNTIKLWYLASKKCAKTFSGHKYRINYVRMISTDRFISCSHDETIQYWSFEYDKCLMVLKGHSSNVNCVQVLSENRIVSCSDDREIKIWDLDDQKCIKTIDHYAKFCYIQLLN